jgi:hydroxymethylpyrimidine pyrophosphatase-like HAD family hydrolase
MPLSEVQQQAIDYFFEKSHFFNHGAVITDLDGTAIFEYKGKFSIPNEVEAALKKFYDLGRPIAINTLRFPLSVMRTFGEDWYRISNRPIPTVLMNGSQLGYIVQKENDELGYEEIAAFPLHEEEIDDVVHIVKDLVEKKAENILLFYYPRNWRKGEIIWTPVPDRIEDVGKKYTSASEVISESISSLQKRLKAEDICMIFLLINVPQDQLMAYQHTRQSNFFTHKGVNKEFGALQLANYLNFKMEDSVGAGDSEMDTFLQSVGLAIQVGNASLPYKGKHCSVFVPGFAELGELLFSLAGLQQKMVV